MGLDKYLEIWSSITVNLHSTTDAVVWAKEFMKLNQARIQSGELDLHTMIGWFANAIETGRSFGASPYVLRDFLNDQEIDQA